MIAMFVSAPHVLRKYGIESLHIHPYQPDTFMRVEVTGKEAGKPETYFVSSGQSGHFVYHDSDLQHLADDATREMVLTRLMASLHKTDFVSKREERALPSHMSLDEMHAIGEGIHAHLAEKFGGDAGIRRLVGTHVPLGTQAATIAAITRRIEEISLGDSAKMIAAIASFRSGEQVDRGVLACGRTGSGKSIALALLAARVRAEFERVGQQSPILFLDTHNDMFEPKAEEWNHPQFADSITRLIQYFAALGYNVPVSGRAAVKSREDAERLIAGLRQPLADTTYVHTPEEFRGLLESGNLPKQIVIRAPKEIRVLKTAGGDNAKLREWAKQFSTSLSDLPPGTCLVIHEAEPFTDGEESRFFLNLRLASRRHGQVILTGIQAESKMAPVARGFHSHRLVTDFRTDTLQRYANEYGLDAETIAALDELTAQRRERTASAKERLRGIMFHHGKPHLLHIGKHLP